MSTLLAFPAGWIPKAHTIIAYTAFSTALFLGWASGLWKELCINSVARWPVEWFPSVSATVGDHPATRAPFQIIIALCATPRFLLLLVQWLVHRYSPSRPTLVGTVDQNQDSSPSKPPASNGWTTATQQNGVRSRHLPEKLEGGVDQVLVPMEEVLETEVGSTTLVDIELFVGIARTFCCGGWVYITSRDNHDLHDFFMIAYLLLSVPWMFLSSSHCSDLRIKRIRRIPFFGFLAMVPPLIWLFYRHSVQRIPGAYTYYSMFEWSLVLWDVAFDSLAIKELGHLQIAIIDTSRSRDHSGTSLISSAGSSQKRSYHLAPTRSRCKSAQKDRNPVDWTAQESASPSPQWRQAVSWLSDVYFAVCFWTIFTSLGFQLFYWSVWKLALAGSELALLANLSGFTLRNESAYRYVTSRQGLLAHRVLAVTLGMGCYLFPWPAARLVGVSFGTWTAWLALFGNWARLRGSEEMVAEGQVLGLGLAITLLLKYASGSVNPFWAIAHSTSGGWNKTGLLLAALSLIEYAYRPVDLHPAAPLTARADKKDMIERSSTKPTKWQQRLITVGLGALIHLIQTFVTDAGTIISWTWSGYPIKGPTLHPFAGIMIAAASSGLMLHRPSLQPVTTTAGLVGSILLYQYSDWTGFFGGLLLVTYLTSILPTYIRIASACPSASTFGYALMTNIILDVLSVITAAYAFVPMGWLLRERTDLVLGFCMLATTAGWMAGRSLQRALPAGPGLPLRSQRRITSINRYTIIASVLLSMISIGYSYGKMPTTSPVPYYPDHQLFSAGIWTVHFGVDKEGRDSQRRMMDLIRDMQVDVVGLLETDLQRFVYGNRDLTRVISEELGYYVDLGPGPNKHTWGAALLSKFPILNSTHHLLPSPNGELAPAIHATLDVHGTKVNVMVSHNGQEEDLLDRTLQTTEIARMLSETEDTPTVFIGYLVTRAGDLRPWPYQILMEDGKMYDIEISDRWRWCEYMAFRGLWRIGYARLHESDISDTELQVGKFLLPKPGHPVVYESNEEMYWHIGEADVPEPWHMPAMFRGEGTRGHRYRVWDGPLYYLPPVRSGMQTYGKGWSTEL